MKNARITEEQMKAIVLDAIQAYNHEIANNGGNPYRDYDEDFTKHYVNRLYAILGATDESDSKGDQK